MNVHQSTLALSVYNALLRCGSLTRAQALAHLQRHWEPAMTDGDLDAGVSYLVERGFISDGEQLATIHRAPTGIACALIRRADDPTQLVLIK